MNGILRNWECLCDIRPDCHHHFDASGTSNAMFDELAERYLTSPLAGTKHTYVRLVIIIHCKKIFIRNNRWKVRKSSVSIVFQRQTGFQEFFNSFNKVTYFVFGLKCRWYRRKSYSSKESIKLNSSLRRLERCNETANTRRQFAWSYFERVAHKWLWWRVSSATREIKQTVSTIGTGRCWAVARHQQGCQVFW